LDFISAYLNGEITEDVHVEIPKEFEAILSNDDLKRCASNKVCKIRKALYGLKQSGRQWYRKLDEKLQSLGLQPLSSDPCVYFININDMLVIVLIYVDDLMVGPNDERALTALKSELAGIFDMKEVLPWD